MQRPRFLRPGARVKRATFVRSQPFVSCYGGLQCGQPALCGFGSWHNMLQHNVPRLSLQSGLTDACCLCLQEVAF